MFLSFTPNPCIERTLRVPNFALGTTARLSDQNVAVSAGGKGLNAARVAAKFGVRTLALAPIGRLERAFFEAKLREEGIEAVLIETPVPTRTCLNIVDTQQANTSTELIEAGTAPDIAIGTQLLEEWRNRLKSSQLALIGGSYPVSDQAAWDSHATLLCHLARAANVPLIYDGKGSAFRRAVFSKTPPWAIKPNLAEAEELLGRDLSQPSEQRRAIRDLMRRGVEVVLLSLGDQGCYLGWRGNIEFFQAPTVETVSAVGSGDALVGAFAAKLLETKDVIQATRWAVAAGAANAAQFEAAQIGPDDCLPLLNNVHQKTVELGLMV